MAAVHAERRQHREDLAVEVGGGLLALRLGQFSVVENLHAHLGQMRQHVVKIGTPLVGQRLVDERTQRQNLLLWSQAIGTVRANTG